MASSDLTGTSILDDFSAEERLAADADVSHGSLLDDEREADIGLEVQADNGISGDTSGGDDADLEAIKARVKEMEEEALKLKKLQSGLDKELDTANPHQALGYSNSNTSINLSYEEKIEV